MGKYFKCVKFFFSMTYLMEHGFDHFLTVGTYVFFRKKKISIYKFIENLKIFPSEDENIFFQKVDF